MSYALDNIRIFKKTLGFKLYPPTRFKTVCKENCFNNIIYYQAAKNIFDRKTKPYKEPCESKSKKNKTYGNNVQR